MNCPLIIAFVTQSAVKKREAHRIMRISNGKPLWLIEQPAGGGDECFGKNHRGNGDLSDQGIGVVEAFRFPAEVAGKIALMIVRHFAKPVEPGDKLENSILQARVINRDPRFEFCCCVSQWLAFTSKFLTD